MKRLVITFIALIAYLVAPYAPVICHALTHVAEVEIADDHAHMGEEHRHEHDADHHALPLIDKAPAVTSQKVQYRLTVDLEEFQLSKISLWESLDFFQALRQNPAPNLEPPGLHLEQGHLSAYSAHSPPA